MTSGGEGEEETLQEVEFIPCVLDNRRDVWKFKSTTVILSRNTCTQSTCAVLLFLSVAQLVGTHPTVDEKKKYSKIQKYKTEIL